jgi:hypothetical protein
MICADLAFWSLIPFLYIVLIAITLAYKINQIVDQVWACELAQMN